MKYGETVILAAGDFPRKGGRAWRLLAAAKRVVCCDGAGAVYRRHFGKWPTVLVGDMDSAGVETRRRAASGGSTVVPLAEQDTNDLAKAVRYCAAQGWKSPIILGATGKRDDHALGNIFRALDFGLDVVTDYGCFTPVEGRRSFTGMRGAAVSVFATAPATRMTSTGLEWPLDGVIFDNLYCATLNRASARRVTLTSTHRVYVYFAS
ncbi:MAG: thiamine diphosphokinase [Kiritimatiellia bacterium]